MINKILITGANGFSAKALINELKKIKNNVLFFSDLQEKSKYLNYFSCDLTRFKDTSNLITKIHPNQIYHLAGLSTNIYHNDYAANVLATKNILDSILKVDIKIRVLLIGSAAEYGKTRSINILEKTLPNPISIYGLTKSFQTQLMKYYFNNHKLNIVMVRPFNLYGKDAPAHLLIGNLFHQISQYKLKKINKINLGNLNAERDYIDVKDAVKDYIFIMERGVSNQIYNIGTGAVTKIKDLVTKVFFEESVSLSALKENNFCSNGIKKSIASISKINKLKLKK